MPHHNISTNIKTAADILYRPASGITFSDYMYCMHGGMVPGGALNTMSLPQLYAWVVSIDDLKRQGMRMWSCSVYSLLIDRHASRSMNQSANDALDDLQSTNKPEYRIVQHRKSRASSVDVRRTRDRSRARCWIWTALISQLRRSSLCCTA